MHDRALLSSEGPRYLTTEANDNEARSEKLPHA
jgi:hypothetical protein